jgi:hypothetical protein
VDDCLRMENLGVIRPLLGHGVLGDAQAQARCQLLQTGLPVQTRTQRRRGLQQGIDQVMHQGAGHVDAVLQVHRTDQRFERIGQDR